MSRLDDFLGLIQQNKPMQYKGLGDFPYGAMWIQNISTYFQSFGDGTPLTQYERICNAEFKQIRQRIEFGFGIRENLFECGCKPSHFRLGKRYPYAIELVRVLHLLTNIYVCLNGDESSGYKCFRCPPPRLEDYLRL